MERVRGVVDYLRHLGTWNVEGEVAGSASVHPARTLCFGFGLAIADDGVWVLNEKVMAESSQTDEEEDKSLFFVDEEEDWTGEEDKKRDVSLTLE